MYSGKMATGKVDRRRRRRRVDSRPVQNSFFRYSVQNRVERNTNRSSSDTFYNILEYVSPGPIKN